MSLSFQVGTARQGRLNQVFVRLAGKLVASADKVSFDMITLWHRFTVEGWPVDTGYSRGTIESPSKIADGHYSFRITASYAHVIEYGGYRGVGPKTHQEGGANLPGRVDINPGIYVNQRPSAPLRRAESRMKLELAQYLAPQLLRASGFGGFGGRSASTAFRGG
jgi:hypothetical protein